MHITHSRSILVALLWMTTSTAVASHVSLQQESRNDSGIQRFVVRSDTQYDRTAQDTDDALALLREQGAAITAWRSQFPSLTPVFVNGDITEFGHGNQWKVMLRHFETQPDTWWGLGNHDYKNNVNDCAGNGCARDSLLHLHDAVDRWGVDAFDYDSYATADGRKHVGSFAYSKTHGDITFIQLNNHYSYHVEFASKPLLGVPSYFQITPSMDWLEKQLIKAYKEKKFVVINMHRPVESFEEGQRNEKMLKRFKDLVVQYRVLAIFHGHTHTVGHRWSIDEVPVFDSGASFNRTFMTAVLDPSANQFSVTIARDNTLESTPVRTVPLRSVSKPEITSDSVNGGKIVARVTFGSTVRELPVEFMKLTLNGVEKSYRINAGSVVIGDVTPATEYSYTLKAYRSEHDAVPEATFTGTFRTQDVPVSPRNLCVERWDAQRGYFILKWDNPHPVPYPPYFIHVLATQPQQVPWTLRPLNSSDKSTYEYVRFLDEDRDPFAMQYKVAYWSRLGGWTPAAVLDGKDLLTSGCQ